MSLSKQIIAYIKITRPLNVVITFFVVVVAILISQKEQTDFYVILLASITAALVAAAGNIVNDIFDIETDKISHPKRVLVSGKISKKEAWTEYIILNSISIIISVSLSIKLMVIVLSTIILLYIYSYALKKLPLIGNLTIAFLTGLTFIYGGYAAGNPVAAIVPAVFGFLINLIREIVKDILDIEGDNKLNYRTLPIKFGIDKSKKLIILITLILIVFTVYPFLTEIYHIEYFIIVMVFVNPLLILCLKLLFNRKKATGITVVSNLLKLTMVLGLVAIYFGK
ncbi:MAG: geranylgeranylglycerol-phosphate geranylgeranyltransferase [Ignavibacteriales bacterium]|nr:geranylgeranylglycerol-phosphate geranylgeranyltransferase [Ignavibacteriales bacterium]